MKKALLIISIGLIFLLDSYGQENEKINFQFNIGTSLTIPYNSSIVETVIISEHESVWKSTDYLSGIGYYVGFHTSYKFSPRFSSSFGLSYVSSSLKVNNRKGMLKDDGVITNTYLNIPVLIKYSLLEKTRIYLSVGPYLGLLLEANERGASSIDTTGVVIINPNDPALEYNEQYENDIFDDYYRIDYGLSLQLDYEIMINESYSGVFLTKFNYGLQNVLSNKLANNNSATEWKNYTFLVGIGLKI